MTANQDIPPMSADQDEGVDVRTRSELSQSADQGMTEVPRNENTTNAAVQADEQPMSTDSASNHCDRSVVTGTDSTSPTDAACVPLATDSNRADKIRAITHLISHGLYKAGRFMASLRIENDPLSTLEKAERLDRIAALEGER